MRTSVSDRTFFGDSEVAGSAFLLMDIEEIGLAELDPSPDVPAPEEEPISENILINSILKTNLNSYLIQNPFVL